MSLQRLILLADIVALRTGDAQNGPATRTVTATNSGTAPLTFALSHQPAAASTYASVVAQQANGTQGANVSFSTASVTVAAGAAASFDVTITAPADLPSLGVYGGYLVLAATSAGGPVYRCVLLW